MKHYEASLTREITRLYKEYFGKGPNHTNVIVAGNVIIVKIEGALSQTEQALISSDVGKDLVVKVRDEIILKQRYFGPAIKDIIGQSEENVCYTIDNELDVLYIFLVFHKDIERIIDVKPMNIGDSDAGIV